MIVSADNASIGAHVRPACDSPCVENAAHIANPRGGEPEAPYARGLEPPRVERRPYSRKELQELFRGGEREADVAEARLVRAARARGGLMFSLGQGLLALKHGDRLAQLGFRLWDYAREILGMEKRSAQALVVPCPTWQTSTSSHRLASRWVRRSG